MIPIGTQTYFFNKGSYTAWAIENNLESISPFFCNCGPISRSLKCVDFDIAKEGIIDLCSSAYLSLSCSSALFLGVNFFSSSILEIVFLWPLTSSKPRTRLCSRISSGVAFNLLLLSDGGPSIYPGGDY